MSEAQLRIRTGVGTQRGRHVAIVMIGDDVYTSKPLPTEEKALERARFIAASVRKIAAERGATVTDMRRLGLTVSR